jgi:hypothetical protein
MDFSYCELEFGISSVANELNRDELTSSTASRSGYRFCFSLDENRLLELSPMMHRMQ